MSGQYNEQALTLDFVKDTIKSVLVKQYDKNTRFIIVKCSENGVIKNIDKSLICNIKILTPDDRAIYNTCEILSDGSIKVPLTESALYSSGVAKAELNIIDSKGSSRIATMTFQIIIKPSVYKDDRVIDSDEFSALTELFEKADKDYTSVITESKEYADAAKMSATNAKTSETNAKNSETNASSSATKAQDSANTATSKASEASSSATSAKNSATASATSASDAKISEDNAKASATKASVSEANAKLSEDNSSIYEKNSKTYMENASISAITASSKADEAVASANSASASENTINIKVVEINQKANDIETIKSDVQNIASDVSDMRDAVSEDKTTIEDTIKNSLLASSEEILASVKDYYDRAQELYNSMYIDCDGETPQQRVVTIVSIDCSTPQSRLHDTNGILFNGGTPLNRQLAS